MTRPILWAIPRPGGPSSANLLHTISRLTARVCALIPTLRNCIMHAARYSIWNVCTVTGQSAIRFSTNEMIRQMHLAMLKAHNVFVDEARVAGVAKDRVFGEATRQLRWHYQWFVLNEFLPALVG